MTDKYTEMAKDAIEKWLKAETGDSLEKFVVQALRKAVEDACWEQQEDFKKVVKEAVEDEREECIKIAKSFDIYRDSIEAKEIVKEINKRNGV